jgi:hypothetical protein
MDCEKQMMNVGKWHGKAFDVSQTRESPKEIKIIHFLRRPAKVSVKYKLL